MNAATPSNPQCIFPACLDGQCPTACLTTERRELAVPPNRAHLRRLAKEALEATKRIEEQMDGG